jgi:hypothetical protein
MWIWDILINFDRRDVWTGGLDGEPNADAPVGFRGSSCFWAKSSIFPPRAVCVSSPRLGAIEITNRRSASSRSFHLMSVPLRTSSLGKRAIKTLRSLSISPLNRSAPAALVDVDADTAGSIDITSEVRVGSRSDMFARDSMSFRGVERSKRFRSPVKREGAAPTDLIGSRGLPERSMVSRL